MHSCKTKKKLEKIKKQKKNRTCQAMTGTVKQHNTAQLTKKTKKGRLLNILFFFFFVGCVASGVLSVQKITTQKEDKYIL